jgi:hypothetical protein
MKMNKVPTWFYVIAGVALLWNIMGAIAVIMNFMITPEEIAMLPAPQQQMYADTPMWSSYGSLVAVVAGAIACLALLIKKAWAYPLFMLSVLGLILQNIGIFVIVDAVSVMGNTVLIMQSLVAVIAVALIFLAKHAIRQEWIK